jgi:hypothetical protein
MQKGAYVRKSKRRQASCPVGVVTGIILILFLSAMGIWLAVDPALDKVLALSTEPPVQSTGPKDRQPPQIYGIQDFIVYQGDPVSYLSGVTATDDLDPEPQLDVDAREVDLSKPGTYTVTYTASDASGNLATACASITVLRKEEGYADLETIYTLADDLLAIILEGTTDTRQQVEAIYNWARTDIRYAGHSDRSDWRQTAYNVIRSGEGDCFGYFAATKLMFERLGISPETRLKSLSKGNKEKVCLILVMSRNAKLYVLDEPIAGVDPAARDYVISTIINNYNPDATVLISTHLISDIEQVLDEVVFINNGHIILQKTVDQIREENGKSVDDLFREVFRW